MRQRMTTVERLEEVARNAIMGGYGIVHTWNNARDPHDGRVRRKVELAISMDCEHPYEYEMHARYSAEHGKRVKPLIVLVKARCRKCGPCRERRTMFWQARAISEWVSCPTTVFGTLTLEPERDVQVDALARIRLDEQGVDFDRLDPGEKFRERVRTAGEEITRWIKRVREGNAVRGKPEIRYLIVAEAHNGPKTSDDKRGRPHWHVLLHEQTKDARLVLPSEWERNAEGELARDRYGNPYVSNGAFLKEQWRWGFSSFALCRSPQAAGYLCKYLTKEDTSVRVRASGRYGHLNESEA